MGKEKFEWLNVKAGVFNPDIIILSSEYFTKDDFELNFNVQLVCGPIRKKLKNCNR